MPHPLAQYGGMLIFNSTQEILQICDLRGHKLVDGDDGLGNFRDILRPLLRLSYEEQVQAITDIARLLSQRKRKDIRHHPTEDGLIHIIVAQPKRRSLAFGASCGGNNEGAQS